MYSVFILSECIKNDPYEHSARTHTCSGRWKIFRVPYTRTARFYSRFSLNSRVTKYEPTNDTGENTTAMRAQPSTRVKWILSVCFSPCHSMCRWMYRLDTHPASVCARFWIRLNFVRGELKKKDLLWYFSSDYDCRLGMKIAIWTLFLIFPDEFFERKQH